MPKLVLQVRGFQHGDWVSVWLVERGDPGDQVLMWGEVRPEIADAIAAATGLKVERERSTLRHPKPFTPPECTPVAEQSLFPEGVE